MLDFNRGQNRSFLTSWAPTLGHLLWWAGLDEYSLSVAAAVAIGVVVTHVEDRYSCLQDL